MPRAPEAGAARKRDAGHLLIVDFQAESVRLFKFSKRLPANDVPFDRTRQVKSNKLRCQDFKNKKQHRDESSSMRKRGNRRNSFEKERPNRPKIDH